MSRVSDCLLSYATTTAVIDNVGPETFRLADLLNYVKKYPNMLLVSPFTFCRKIFWRSLLFFAENYLLHSFPCVFCRKLFAIPFTFRTTHFVFCSPFFLSFVPKHFGLLQAETALPHFIPIAILFLGCDRKLIAFFFVILFLSKVLGRRGLRTSESWSAFRFVFAIFST